MNRVELKGTVRTVRKSNIDGSRVATFSIVTEYHYKSPLGIMACETAWHNVVAFDSADIDYDLIEKGSKVYVCGRLRTAKYIGSEGTERYYYEIIANKVASAEE